ncbi:MAG: 30S ribosomal protein S9 [Candidatus Aenigmatarchaeota archaeon]
MTGPIVSTGKRKTSVARATIRAGTGHVVINGTPIDLYKPEYARLKIREAMMLSGDLIKKVDISINVKGGGVSSQADAIRQSIAKGLVEFFNDENLKKIYLEYDRNLLVYDSRRTEPHKPSRSRKGARRHKQRSKR